MQQTSRGWGDASRWRRAAGLTQQQLADRAQVSIASIRDLEQGRVTRPRGDSTRRLAEALGLAPQQRESLARTTALAPRPPEEDNPAQPANDPPPIRNSGPGLRIHVLGPLEAWHNGREIHLGRAGQRALLGLLAVHPCRTVPRDVIIDTLWGDRPPQSAVAIVQTHVSRLRSLLDRHRQGGRMSGSHLIRVGTGYRLRVTAKQIDLVTFTQLIERAREVSVTGDSRTACEAFDAALRLWRGKPLSDIDLMRSHPAVAGITEHRAAAVAQYADIACLAGWHHVVLPHLRALASSDLLNEGAHARLMIALAGTGRQAAALRVYEDIRLRLEVQLGIMPGAELAEAHMRVIRQEIPAQHRQLSSAETRKLVL
jgi:DNA-binding SARP family transcriptional activator/DNA-binding XRE family transcriptional regulator